MPERVANGTKKRKQGPEGGPSELQKGLIQDDVGLEMQSEDEGEEGSSISEDGEDAEEFPELDTDSDSEDGEEDEDEESTEEGDEEDEEEGAASDDSLHVFPRAKTIKSDITGQPKKVYPEIEPDYASDSSTEDVGPF